MASTLFQQSHKAGSAAYEEDSHNAFILREIAASEAEAGRVNASFRWASRQKSPLARANALLEVAEGMQKTMHDARDANNLE